MGHSDPGQNQKPTMIPHPRQVGRDRCPDIGGEHADLDDDADGFPDVLEAGENTNPLDALSVPPDLDLDFIPDRLDPDRDRRAFERARAFSIDVWRRLDLRWRGLRESART